MNKKVQVEAYTKMVKIRHFEEEAVKQLRSGMPGFIHSYVGQEAMAVGACSALREDDYITSTHRGHGHIIAKIRRLLEQFNEMRFRRACRTCRRPRYCARPAWSKVTPASPLCIESCKNPPRAIMDTACRGSVGARTSASCEVARPLAVVFTRPSTPGEAESKMELSATVSSHSFHAHVERPNVSVDPIPFVNSLQGSRKPAAYCATIKLVVCRSAVCKVEWHMSLRKVSQL